MFISSTSDLRSARGLVANVLHSMGYDPIWQEIEPTDGGELLEVLRRRMHPCRMMIQLVGHRYGAEPPEGRRSPEFGRVSYTQFEALHFEKLGRKVIYHFLRSDFPTDPISAEPSALTALQANYKTRIQGANHLRQTNIATTQDLELSIQRIRDELAVLRGHDKRRYRQLLILAGGALGASVLVGAGVLTGHYLLSRGQTEQTGKIDQQTAKVDQQVAKAEDHSKQLARIESILLSQRQSNPNAETRLPDTDNALLKKARSQGDLKSRAAASVLTPDADTDDLLNQLKASQSAGAFDLAMLQGKRWYFDRFSEYDKAIPFFERAKTLRPDSFEARSYAIVAHTFARKGDVASHRKRAIEICQETLQLVQPGSTAWARIQAHLGTAWGSLATGSRAANLTNSLAAYEASLQVYTPSTHPVDWAMTQNNIATAWLLMPTGDRAANLTRANDALEAALQVLTLQDNPDEWAGAQNNLGRVWTRMPTGDRTANLTKAIASYEAALQVRTRESSPNEWAETQNNLGAAWSELPTGDRAANQAKAIAAFEAAMLVYTRQHSPRDWAMTQTNIGAALLRRPARDRAERAADVSKAIMAYEAALEVYTQKEFPDDWAMTHSNLGAAWVQLPAGDRATNLNSAIASFEAALRVHTRQGSPESWAQSQNNLGIAWRNFPTGDRAENLKKSIAAFDAALQVHTRRDFPEYWAGTRHNLSMTFADLADLPGEDRVARLRQAIASGKAALLVRTAEAFPDEYISTSKNLAIDRKAYEAIKGAAQIPFDQIPPAE